jgi:hypothetical protein
MYRIKRDVDIDETEDTEEEKEMESNFRLVISALKIIGIV